MTERRFLFVYRGLKLGADPRFVVFHGAVPPSAVHKASEKPIYRRLLDGSEGMELREIARWYHDMKASPEGLPPDNTTPPPRTPAERPKGLIGFRDKMFKTGDLPPPAAPPAPWKPKRERLLEAEASAGESPAAAAAAIANDNDSATTPAPESPSSET